MGPDSGRSSVSEINREQSAVNGCPALLKYDLGRGYKSASTINRPSLKGRGASFSLWEKVRMRAVVTRNYVVNFTFKTRRRNSQPRGHNAPCFCSCPSCAPTPVLKSMTRNRSKNRNRSFPSQKYRRRNNSSEFDGMRKDSTIRFGN
jgi:hypothetical protein